MIDSIFVQIHDDAAANCTFANRRYVEKLLSNRPNGQALFQDCSVLLAILGDTPSKKLLLRSKMQ